MSRIDGCSGFGSGSGSVCFLTNNMTRFKMEPHREISGSVAVVCGRGLICPVNGKTFISGDRDRSGRGQTTLVYIIVPGKCSKGISLDGYL